MSAEDQIRLFRMSHQMLESDLDAVERRYGVNLGRYPEEYQDKDKEYYPQFEEAVRKEASEMAAHYELFYCLEKSIRGLIKEKLQEDHGAGWWGKSVPPLVQENANKNIKREIESGVTQRSTELIDYTTFGELGEIVRANWTTFSDTFNNEKAFTRVMANLNVLRGPIAHCSSLAPDEVDRLNLTLKDWFRLMS